MKININTIILKKILNKLKNFLIFSIPSFLVSFIFLEIIVRLFFNVSDSPEIYFDNNLGNLFSPNQQGIYIKGKKNEIRAAFSINKEGWNSPHNYQKEKKPQTTRIAIVGDSYIEALNVDIKKSYPYLLEDKLNQAFGNQVNRFEVYTFGHSGANLSHYQHILDFVENNYKPDVAVINIVLNDFTESVYGLSRKDNWSVDLDAENLIEKPPSKVSNLFIKLILRKSALIRFLSINLDLVNKSPVLNSLYYAETRKYENQINLENKISDENIKRVINYLLKNIKDIGIKNNTKIFLVIDSPRQSIYENKAPQENKDYKYVLMTKEIAKQLNLPIVDLTDTFIQDWQKNHKRFDLAIDEHWDEYGHQVVATSLINSKLFAVDSFQENSLLQDKAPL